MPYCFPLAQRPLKLNSNNLPNKANQNTMPSHKPRPIPRKIHITRHNPPTIPTHDLHRNARPPLQATSNIPTIPRHPQRNLRINANRRKHRASVLNPRFPARRKHRKSRNGNDLEREQKDAALAHAISIPRRGDGEETCAHVRRDGHELRVVGGVAHVFNNRGQEEGEGVDGTEASHADEHEDVDFPVGEGLVDVFHVEVVGEMAAVGFKAALDFGAFGGREEAGARGGLVDGEEGWGREGDVRVGVIVYTPVCNDGYED
jgi:hypothetical protein